MWKLFLDEPRELHRPVCVGKPVEADAEDRRVEPGVADVREAFNPLSSVNDAGPMLESSCAENPNSLFGAEGTLPVPQTDKPDF